jgi:HD-GYP domain-containing protein (c-di-GMP phosphodiesterase class II)
VRHGARILQPFPEIAAIREMVEHHHEFFDGSGYPDGLAGEAISLGARIIALADAYDTITSERSYQRARSAEEAFTVLERCSGAQFDPRLVELFVEALRRRSHPLIDVTPAAVPVATTAS